MRFAACTMAVLMILSTFVLGGCKDHEGPGPADPNDVITADNLLERMGEAMNSISSYTMEGGGTLKTTYMGVAVEVDVSMVEKKVGGEGNALASYSRTEMLGMANGQTVVNNVELNGYYNGKMFQATGDSTKVTGIYSTLSPEDYQLFQKDNEEDEDFSSVECTVKSCEEVDGNWVATYSGFTDFGAFGSLTEGMDSMFEEGVSFKDIKLTFTTGKDLVLKKADIEFIFASEDENATLPVFTMSFQIKDAGSTTVTEVDLSQYKEVYDLRIAHTLEKAYTAREERAQGGYVAVIKQTTRSGNEKPVTSEETDTVSYGVRDGNFEYFVKAVTGNYRIEQSYWMGQKRIIVRNGSWNAAPVSNTTEESTDEDERAFIRNNMNPAQFDAFNVSDIQKVEGEDDVYLITIANPNTDPFSNFVDEPQVTATLRVSLYNGELLEALYTYSGSVNYGISTATYSLTSNIEFSNK